MGKKQKKPVQPSWVADVLREIGVRAPHPQIKAGFVSRPDKDYLRHEALDRCSLLAAQVEEWLLEHPAIRANAEWREKVGQAAALLHEVYQAIGAEHMS